MKYPKTNAQKGGFGESYVYCQLRAAGIKARWVPLDDKNSGDFLTPNGKYLDVKFSYPRLRKLPNGQIKMVWSFNLNHQNKRQADVDFFICVCQGAGIDFRAFVIPRDLLSAKTFGITDEQLVRGKYDFFESNWDLIKNPDSDIIATKAKELSRG